MSAAYRGEFVVRGAYEAPRVDPVVICSAEEDLCRQADRDSCDINRIVSTYYRVNGGLPPVPEQVFADVSHGWDYRELMEKAKAAELYFAELPSDMRERYGNDVSVFLDEIHSDARLEDAVALGLREKAVVPEVPNEVPANPPG